jgi:hypothetical protein
MPDAGRTGPGEHSVTVGIERGVAQVAVGVD